MRFSEPVAIRTAPRQRYCSISSDGKHIVTFGSENKFFVLDLETKKTTSIETERPLSKALFYEDDAKMLALEFSNETVSCIDWTTDKEQLSLKFGNVSRQFWQPPKAGVFILREGANILVWDLKKGECLTEWRAHFEGVFFVHASPNLETVISNGRDFTVKVWRPKGEKVDLLREYKGYHWLAPNMSLSKDGKLATLFFGDGTLERIDVEKNQGLKRIKLKEYSRQPVFFSPDQSMLALRIGGKFSVLSTAGLKEVGSFSLENVGEKAHIHVNWSAKCVGVLDGDRCLLRTFSVNGEEKREGLK